MSYPVKDPTPLDERMRLFTKGQVTWPEPKLNQRCRTCVEFVADHKGGQDLGHCHALHERRKLDRAKGPGDKFPASSIACSVFKATRP